MSARWKGEAAIIIVTPMDAGPPKKRPRVSKQEIEVQAENAEEAKERIRSVVMNSKFPPKPGDEIVIENVRQV